MDSPVPVRLTTHADVVAAATDPTTFSSHTSVHLHVPNGMDGEEHRTFRTLVDSYMTSDVVAGLEPRLAEIARQVVRDMPRGETVDVIAALGEPFAVHAQCDWLGWPAEFEPRLSAWMERNYTAAHARDADLNAEVAADFDQIVRDAIASAAPGSVTARLAAEHVNGRPLTTEEAVSILRNWTAGDLGSIARCIGVIVWRLASTPPLQQRVRMLTGPEHRAELDAILLECLRIEDPFVANRRRATCPVTLPSGAAANTGDIVMLDWTAANRDPEVFADTFDPHAHLPHNLVFGIGPHGCPGFELSMAELRASVLALTAGTQAVEPAGDAAPVPHEAPLGGWRVVPVVLS